MPEGPEVRLIAQDLAKEVTDKILENVEIISGRYIKKSIDGLSDAQVHFPIKIVGAGCHGKFMYILTNSDYNIWITLGMTGRWTKEETKHVRVKFNFSDGSYVNFEDIRNFGTIKFVKGKQKFIKKLKELGPDLLVDDIDPYFFVNRMREHSNKNITEVMMNQSIFAGIGNYIKAEALWLSCINPMSNIDDLEDGQLISLLSSIKNVMETSLKNGGATVKSYKGFDGSKGNATNFFKCYGRKLDEDGNKVEKITTPDGRTTHWAPIRQGV